MESTYAENSGAKSGSSMQCLILTFRRRFMNLIFQNDNLEKSSHESTIFEVENHKKSHINQTLKPDRSYCAKHRTGLKLVVSW